MVDNESTKGPVRTAYTRTVTDAICSKVTLVTFKQASSCSRSWRAQAARVVTFLWRTNLLFFMLCSPLMACDVADVTVPMLVVQSHGMNPVARRDSPSVSRSSLALGFR